MLFFSCCMLVTNGKLVGILGVPLSNNPFHEGSQQSTPNHTTNLATCLKWINEPNRQIGAIHDVPQKKPIPKEPSSGVDPFSRRQLWDWQFFAVWGFGVWGNVPEDDIIWGINPVFFFCGLWTLKPSSKNPLDMARHDRDCSTFLNDGCHFSQIFFF